MIQVQGDTVTLKLHDIIGLLAEMEADAIRVFARLRAIITTLGGSDELIEELTRIVSLSGGPLAHAVNLEIPGFGNQAATAWENAGDAEGIAWLARHRMLSAPSSQPTLDDKREYVV